MAQTVFGVLLGQLDEEIDGAMNALRSGAISSHAEYRHVTGLIRGLESSKQLVKDLESNFTGDHDE